MAKPDAVRGIAESLGPLIVRPDAQTPKRPGVQAPSRVDAQTPARFDAQTSGRPTALSEDPQLSKKTLYLNTDAMTDAYRKYQDRNRGQKVTESGFVQSLIDEYLGA